MNKTHLAALPALLVLAGGLTLRAAPQAPASGAAAGDIQVLKGQGDVYMLAGPGGNTTVPGSGSSGRIRLRTSIRLIRCAGSLTISPVITSTSGAASVVSSATCGMSPCTTSFTVASASPAS